MRTRYANEVRESHMYDFLRVDGRKELLLDYAHQKIAFGPSRFRRVSRGWRIPFVATWQRQGEKCLMKFERRLRSDLLSLVLVGVEAEQVGGPANAPLSSLLAPAEGRNDGQERGIAIREPEAGVLRPVRGLLRLGESFGRR